LQAELLFEVPPEAFDPPPKVQSAIVRLTPTPRITLARLRRRRPGAHREGCLRAAPQDAAQQPQGNCRRAQLADCGIDPGARAETLSLAQYVALAAHLAQ
jgi:16S rRNA (adenine1518-N6/adenine1519-N6)-dimethyltransferase